MTIEEIAITLKVRTTLAAKIASVCLLKGFIDLIFCKRLSVKIVHP